MELSNVGYWSTENIRCNSDSMKKFEKLFKLMRDLVEYPLNDLFTRKRTLNSLI